MASGALETTERLPLPAFLAEKSSSPASNNDNLPAAGEGGPANELDCLRGILTSKLLAWAEARGAQTNLGADRVLIRHGLIDESTYLDRLAVQTGVRRETFSTVSRKDCPLRDDQLPRAAQQGVMPLRQNGELIWVIAPRGFTARRLSRFAAQFPEHAHRIRIASGDELTDVLLTQTNAPMAEAAVDGLHRRWPALSAVAGQRPVRRLVYAAVTAAALLAIFLIAPEAFGVTLALCFLAFASLRLGASLLPRSKPVRLRRLTDAELPDYTILVALYREATSVAPLLEALDALDYPREKLHIILAVEPNDLETRAAIARLGARPRVRTIIAPALGPQTKPKALNFALPFVQGTFLAVYDAEDRPEPNQLRAALDAFRSQGPDLACAQASLCIDNPSDSWLSCMFTAEYAGQFDVFLQGLSNFNLPIPLGGSSNHFRTATLREVGAWDAYNVTEDADLGVRFARFGYRSAMFASTTFEEAPSQFGPWLRQRSRWMKGWMQTWLVHMRSPPTLWRDAGARGFITLNLIVGCNVLTALSHPFLIGAIGLDSIVRAIGSPSAFLSGRLATLHLLAIALGYVTAAAIGFAGLVRRGLPGAGWVLLLMPVYWILLSVAAWRALYQLVREPYRWEKTEHGLARSALFSRGIYAGRDASDDLTAVESLARKRTVTDIA